MTSVTQLLEGWVEGLNRQAIVLPRCTACNSWNWYPRIVCTKCGSEERHLQQVRPQGRIHTWTRVYRALPPVVNLPVPYVIGFVSLADAPDVRLPCRAVDPARDPIVGEEVELGIVAEVAQKPFVTFSCVGRVPGDRAHG